MNYKVCDRKLLFVEDDEQLKNEMVAYFSPENAVCTASDVVFLCNRVISTRLYWISC